MRCVNIHITTFFNTQNFAVSEIIVNTHTHTHNIRIASLRVRVKETFSSKYTRSPPF